MSQQPLMYIRIYFAPKYRVNAFALMMIVTLIASLIPAWRTVHLHSHSAEVMR